MPWLSIVVGWRGGLLATSPPPLFSTHTSLPSSTPPTPHGGDDDSSPMMGALKHIRLRAASAYPGLRSKVTQFTVG